MARRSANAMLLNGIDAEYHDGPSVYAKIPGLNPNPRFPILGGVNQPRGGSARHDAVAWGYARAASALGVDIIQNCEVQDFIIEGGQVGDRKSTRLHSSH